MNTFTVPDLYHDRFRIMEGLFSSEIICINALLALLVAGPITKIPMPPVLSLIGNLSRLTAFVFGNSG